MKKLAFLLAALLLLSACSVLTAPAETSADPATEATAAVTEQPTCITTEAPIDVPTEAPTESDPTETVSAELEIALSFVGKDLNELKTVLGEPDEVYYEDSCSGDGDDGILNFGSVTVYTYREADGSAETVIDAELSD